jgi:hypothetical protein
MPATQSGDLLYGGKKDEEDRSKYVHTGGKTPRARPKRILYNSVIHVTGRVRHAPDGTTADVVGADGATVTVGRWLACERKIISVESLCIPAEWQAYAKKAQYVDIPAEKISVEKFLQQLMTDSPFDMDAGYLRLEKNSYRDEKSYYKLDTREQSKHEYEWDGIIEQWHKLTKKMENFVFEMSYVLRDDDDRDDILIKDWPKGERSLDPTAPVDPSSPSGAGECD